MLLILLLYVLVIRYLQRDIELDVPDIGSNLPQYEILITRQSLKRNLCFVPVWLIVPWYSCPAVGLLAAVLFAAALFAGIPFAAVPTPIAVVTGSAFQLAVIVLDAILFSIASVLSAFSPNSAAVPAIVPWPFVTAAFLHPPWILAALTVFIFNIKRFT